MTTDSEKATLNSSIKSNEFGLTNQKYIRLSHNGIFNSKLFIDLDSNFTQSLENSFSSECETNINIEDSNKERFLIKELIDEIDYPDIPDNKIDENHDLFLSLINTGYEFIPKKYLNQQKKKSKQQDKLKSKFGPKKTGKNIIKERKGDWVCIFCHNINFAFRTVCNRCKGKKEECLQKVIM